MTDPSSTGMRAAWDHLARTNPRFYIATAKKEWGDEDFYASGRKTVDRLLALTDPDRPRTRALEIGCGVGRLTRALAERFDAVDAVDVSAEMIALAREMQFPENVTFQAVIDPDLKGFPDQSYDLILSHLVFQHIPDARIIQGYLNSIGRLLTPAAGRAIVQMDTRPVSPVRTLYMTLPDFLLARVHRRHIRRYPRRADEVRRWIREAHLVIEDEPEPNTAEHLFVLTRVQ